MTDTITDNASVSFACPRCRNADIRLGPDSAICEECDTRYERHDSIWNFLPLDRANYYSAFLDGYTRIRKAEGRASDDPAEFHQLPQCRSDHPLARQWHIRRGSYVALMSLLNERLDPGAKVLDLGAGVGWLSNRLHAAGYNPCAIDLSDDDGDGLGAARHYSDNWPRVVAEFDRLPLADAAADAAIFNSSFHYSTDYSTTLREAMRVVRPGGLIVVLDTPVYRKQASGQRMLEEQYDSFEARFGERSDSLAVSGFLTWKSLEELADATGLRWHRKTPWFGWRWAMRPLLARVRGQREPARFTIIWSTRT